MVNRVTFLHRLVFFPKRSCTGDGEPELPDKFYYQTDLQMNPLASGSIVTLGDLFRNPVRKAIGNFNDFASCYGLQPFKLITVSSPVLIGRFQLKGLPGDIGDDNRFLSVLAVNLTVRMEEVYDFVTDLSSAVRLPVPAQMIIKNMLDNIPVNETGAGRNWAFNQAKFALRLFSDMARNSGVQLSFLNNYDQLLTSEVLGLDKEKWSIFSVMTLTPNIRITPQSLLNSTYGLN